jgi:hypothetical protein
MALIYDREKAHLKDLEVNRQIIPAQIWGSFDRHFTHRVNESLTIFKNNNYKISQDDSAILLGLFQSAAKFLSTIKISSVNEIKSTGEITLSEGLCHLIHHCLRNDLNSLSYITDDLANSKEPSCGKDLVDKCYNSMFELVDKLKILTKE